MNKLVKFFILSIGFFYSVSMWATELGIMTPEYALKRIENTNIIFISAEKISHGIRTTKVVDVEALSNHDILGNTDCSPFYICPKKIENILKRIGIKKEDKLIIYDNSYGLNSSVLYILLESIGHKKLRLLNGDFRVIKTLDPNQVAYTEFLLKYNQLLRDNNNSNSSSELEILKMKMKVLEPLLLFVPLQQEEDLNGNYFIKDNDLDSEYMVGKLKLMQIVDKIREEGRKTKIRLIDTCSLVDIVGNQYGSYVSGVRNIDWKDLIDTKKRGYKSLNELKQLFKEAGIRKEDQNYLYCMSGSPKAFYVLYALRMAGYNHVKVFTGDWNIWIGDKNVK